MMARFPTRLGELAGLAVQRTRRGIRLAWRRARGSRRLRALTLASFRGTLFAVLCSGGLWWTTVRVAPGAVGVLQENWGAGGLGEKDLQPGLHFAPRGWTSLHQLDGRVQLASFGFKSEGANLPALEVRTTEGNTAKVHVQVSFRLRPGGAHDVVAAGLKLAWRQRVTSRIEDTLCDAFSRLTSENLMDPETLEAAAHTVRDGLNRELASLQAEANHVLVSGVFFPGPYEAKLQEKQLESQAIRTDESLARRARMKTENALAAHGLEMEERELTWQLERETEELRIELEKQIAREARSGTDEFHARGLAAEQSYHVQVAEGDLALARAQARRQQLLGQALDGAGGRLFIAQELAQTLRFAQVTLDPDGSPNPLALDLDHLMALFVGE